MRNAWTFAFLLANLFLSGSAPAEESSWAHWQSGLGFNYSEGTYGGTDKVTTVSIPVTVQRLFDRGNLDLVIPYLRVRSNGQVTVVGGGSSSPAGPGIGTTLPRGGGHGRKRSRVVQEVTVVSTTTVTTSQAVTQEGMGDIELQGHWDAIEQEGFRPTVGIGARLKIPTASTSKRLGDGKLGEGLSFVLSKTVVPKVDVSGSGGYTWLGKPTGVDLRNIWSYSLTSTYHVTGLLSGSFAYEESLAAFAGEPNSREVQLGAHFEPRAGLQFHLTGTVGLSDSAADLGVLSSVQIRWDHFASLLHSSKSSKATSNEVAGAPDDLESWLMK